MKTSHYALLAAVSVLGCLPPAAQALGAAQPIVTLGPETITRSDYVADHGALPVGRDVLRKMVFSALVFQAAAKAGVMPTEADVDARVKDITAHQPALAPQVVHSGRTAESEDRYGARKPAHSECGRFRCRGRKLLHPKRDSVTRCRARCRRRMVVCQSKADSERAEISARCMDLAPEAIARQAGPQGCGRQRLQHRYGSPSRLMCVQTDRGNGSCHEVGGDQDSCRS